MNKINYCIKITGIMILIFGVNSCNMNKQIENEKTGILMNANRKEKTIDKKDIEHLPVQVQNWLINSGIIGKNEIKIVQLTQKALMKTKPEQKKWYTAKANQWITTEPPAYIWTVKLNIMQILRIKGRDKFEKGKGNMLMKMNSLFTIGNDSGKKIDEGSIQRFLAEMIWYPSFAISDYVKWDSIDIKSAKANITYNKTKGSVTFFFNNQGEVKQITALRYKGNKEEKRYQWTIKIKEHSIFNGLKIPTKTEVIWKLDSGDWKWLDLEITDYKYK